MRSFTLRRGRGNFTAFLVILFVLVAIGTFAFLQKTGKLAEYKINMFSSIGTDEISFDKEPEPADNNKDLSIGIVEGTEEDSKVEEKTEDLSILPVRDGEYKETAENGDGITNLARRALGEYLNESESELSSEHRIFVEDYVQNHIGEGELQAGETISISESLIVEGINKAQGLSAEELENLENFTELVWETGFRF
jgi:hypothetical protein